MELTDFKEELKKLEPTTQQEEIINTDLSLSVVAGAGSGKTKVLVDKIIAILNEEDLELNNFSIITFTNKAAVEMKDRLRDRLYFEWLRWEVNQGDPTLKKSKEFWRRQVELCEMVDISTIHKFCEEIIRKYGLIINQPTNFKIKSISDFLNKKTRELITSYADKDELSEVKSYKLQEFIIKYYRDNDNKGLEIDKSIIDEIDLSNKEGTDWEIITKVFFKIYNELMEEVKQYKKDNNILTSNDLIKYAVRILEESDYALNKLANKYNALFIDEFQDTNRHQYRLVEKLQGRGIGIFLVGDEKQSIYRFRGADVKTFIEMNETSDIIDEQKYLADNFRTDEQLLETINEIFSHKFKDDKNNELKVSSKDEYKALNSEKSKEDSRDYESFLRVKFGIGLKKVIKYLNKVDEISYNDIAVLFRSNWRLNEEAKKLKETEIPVEVIGGKAFYSSKPVIDTFKLLYHLLHANGTSKAELKYIDFYKSYKRFDVGVFDGFLDELKKRIRVLSVDNLLEFIYNQTRIRDYYTEEKLFQELANLEKLKDLSINIMDKDFIQPIEFCNYLGLMIETEQEEEEAEVAEKLKKEKGVVSLISIHKSKGLEYPVVIVPSIDKQLNRDSVEPKIIFDEENDEKKMIAFKARELYDEWDPQYLAQNQDPDYDSLNRNDQEERLAEELRILYVALTRVENMLILLGDERPTGSKGEISWANWLKKVKIDGRSLLDKYRFDFS
ncbi:UvrD-helicase domain-containing protein [Selenihalanaerobacter shriftii]|uniref:DNA 3'-5' helicase n=1 Tax=Selenihalanaerobacter shriftii TaxID=142842 RepID=A0A1T4NFW5_9FIRM|nr:UvrD-helicase domain-containing protein [Selenihalanaerobacter shriftii]SJZ77936.1 Superfamily I DNA or RNA helicase [Selenihalanaerobacter shriftii]